MAKRFLLMISLVTLFGRPSFAKTPDTDCVNWFKSAKLTAGTKGCELKCAILMTDMGTIMCPDQCDLLCKATETDSIAGKLIYYPGLTPAEKKLAEKNPKYALAVFIQKTRIDSTTFYQFK